MSTSIPLQHLDTNLWLMDYQLKRLGMDFHRVVSIIRLESGKLIIHSTAPFSPVEIDSIQELGQPEWLVDVLLRHDTFAAEGHAAFPEASYLAPEGFSKNLPFPTGSLLSSPAEWAGEVEVASVDGVPDFGEIAMFHQTSRTLIVGDLLFNFSGELGVFTKSFLHLAMVGGHYEPGFSKPFKSAIKNPAAFSTSVQKILEWDFDRIIVGHGNFIASGGKEKMRAALETAGVI